MGRKIQYYQNVSSSNLIYRFNVKRMRGQFRVGNSIPKHTCGKELIQNIQKQKKLETTQVYPDQRTDFKKCSPFK